MQTAKWPLFGELLKPITRNTKGYYLAVSMTDGSTMAWINGGGPDNWPNAAKVVWYPHGTIGTGVGTNGKGVQFADLMVMGAQNTWMWILRLVQSMLG